MGITCFRRFYARNNCKMIIYSTVLVILLFATPNADAAQRCNRWNTCYEQIQQQESSALQEAFMTINRTLSAQNRKIELLEQEKSEMNNTIQLLEVMLYEQAKQINKLVETYSGLKEIKQPSKE